MRCGQSLRLRISHFCCIDSSLDLRGATYPGDGCKPISGGISIFSVCKPVVCAASLVREPNANQ